MALLFMDSFDHYATADLSEKWTSVGPGVAVGAGTGRHSSASAEMTGSGPFLRKTLAPSAPTTVVVGVSFRRVNPAVSEGNIIEVSEGDLTKHITVGVNPGGQLFLARGGTASPGSLGTKLATGPTGLTAGVAYYIELKATIHDTLGVAEVWLNGILEVSYSGDTRFGGTGNWAVVTLAASNIASFFDDVYILDQSGPAPWNTVLGDVRVDARLPTAEGASSAWTPLSGTDNALMVDDPAPDDDATYVSAATAGPTDTHVVQDAPVVGALLYGVQVVLSARKSDAGTCTLAGVVRHSGVNYPGAAVTPGTTYAYGTTPYATNPGTSAAWTEAGFNAAEFGYTRTA